MADTTKATRAQRREGKSYAKEVAGLLKRGRKRLAPRPLQRIEAGLASLRQAVQQRDGAAIDKAIEELSPIVDQHLAFARKSTFREYAESIGTAVAIALLLRFFVVEAFKIPSGSMVPTLLVGDHIFVNKFIYGLRVPLTDKWLFHFQEPQRGDVIVFMYPDDRDKDFIKRVVGVPGDRVEIRDGELQVTDAAGKRVPVRWKTLDPDFHYLEEGGVPSPRGPAGYVEMEEVLGEHTYDVLFRKDGRSMQSFGPVTVRPNSVFVMGDNRDNSHDSRFWGQVPYDLIKGKALVIWYSGVHWSRMGQLVE